MSRWVADYSRWPTMVAVDGLLRKRYGGVIAGRGLVCVDWQQDVLWFASPWLVWLYRLIPSSAGFSWDDWQKIDDSYYLCWVHAPAWGLGLRMGAWGRRFPVLVLRLGRGIGRDYYLPWGAWLYNKVVTR